MEVSTTSGALAALMVPISGMLIWKSDSTSSRNASNSSSARSSPSTSSTAPEPARIAEATGAEVLVAPEATAEASRDWPVSSPCRWRAICASRSDSSRARSMSSLGVATRRIFAARQAASTAAESLASAPV